MGRRAVNSTKGGKFMNPTDQARKEARKRELKKNKKQRMAVRHAVLKGKDPLQLIEDIADIDKMEFDPTNPPLLNEKVLKDKRKKLKETFERIMKLYEKEDPEYALDLQKADFSCERKRAELESHYEEVKMAERVTLAEIPLPAPPPSSLLPTSQIPLPDAIDLICNVPGPPPSIHSILKKSGPPGPPLGPVPRSVLARRRKPAGPPPGPPADLSESEQEMETDELLADLSRVPLPPSLAQTLPRAAPVAPPGGDIPLPPGDIRQDSDDSDDEGRPAKPRKIRFEDDGVRDPNEEEKDTRPKYKPAVSPLQVKMLQMAGQVIPMKPADSDDEEYQAELAALLDKNQSGTSEKSEKSRERRERERDRRRRRERRHSSSSSSSSDDEREPRARTAPSRAEKADDDSDSSDDNRAPPEPGVPGTETPGLDMAAPSALPLTGVPTGVPPPMPPGPPPGLPPMMFRPPPLRPGPPGGPIRMLPPGPPPGRPPGMPPGPPPGLPPNMRPPQRLMGVPPQGQGPPGVLPPRAPPVRQPGPPMGMPMGMGGVNPNVLSAPPSIRQLPLKPPPTKENSATIVAKPQLKHSIGDVTRFTPTALRVRREVRDHKGRLVKSGQGKADAAAGTVAAPTVPTKDDAYDSFMKEMEALL